MSKIYLVELTGLDANGSATVFRWSSGSDFMTVPSDTPGNAVYEARLNCPGNFEWDCWGKGTTRGTSSRTFGVIKLVNSDGGLDYLANYGFDGQPVAILLGDSAQPRTQFTTLFAGRCRRVDVLWGEVDIAIIDWQSDVADRSLQTTKYLGTNVGATGVEGLPSDLQGKPKPLLRGTAANFNPPCVNTSLLIYQIDDGSAVLPMTVANVWDRGVALTFGTARASLAAMQASGPASGAYDTYAGPDGWFIRLGAQTAGTLTVTASEGSLADRTAAQIVKRLLTGQGNVPAANINNISVQTCDGVKPYEVGFWSGTSETTIGQVIDMVLDSINGCLINTRQGLFTLGVLTDPAMMTPVAGIAAWQIKDSGPSVFSVAGANDPGTGLRISPPINGQIGTQRYSTAQDATIGLPIWRVLLQYDHNLSVLPPSQLAGAAPLSYITYAGQEYRQYVASNAAVLNQHAKAPEFTVNTQIHNQADAITEANIQLALRSIRRVIVTIPIDPADAAPINLLSCITLTIPRFGWDSGKSLLVIGMIEDYGDGITSHATTTLICWG